MSQGLKLVPKPTGADVSMSDLIVKARQRLATKEVSEAMVVLEELQQANEVERLLNEALEPCAKEIQEILDKDTDEFNEGDLKRMLLLAARSRVMGLVELLTDKNPKVRLEAWKIVKNIHFGDVTKVEHTGANGKDMKFEVVFVPPKMR